jgi:hypothetical protein
MNSCCTSKRPKSHAKALAFYRIADPTAQCYALPADNRDVGIISVSPALAFDTIVIFFLVIGLYRRYRISGSMVSLKQLIIRDGLLYFSAIFATNAAWLVANVVLDVRINGIIPTTADLNFNQENLQAGLLELYVLSNVADTSEILMS